MASQGVRNQKALSELSGVSETTISKTMSGSQPSMDTVEKISIALGYLVNEFIALGE